MHPQSKTWSLDELLNATALELRDSRVLLIALPGLDYEDPEWRKEAARREEANLSLSREVIAVLRRLATAAMRSARQARGQQRLNLGRWRKSQLEVLRQVLAWAPKPSLGEETIAAMQGTRGDPLINNAQITLESAGIWSIGRAAQQLIEIALSGTVHLRRCQALWEDETGKCGRYFVSPTREGHPVQFCSDRCRERNRRVRRRLAARRYRDRLKR